MSASPPVAPATASTEVDARIATLERELAHHREDRARRDACEEDASRFRMLLDSVHDYAFITFDLDGLVVGWSRGAERILGYDTAAAMGLPSRAFFTPEDAARGADVREFVLAREQGHAEDERWHLRRDGSRFWGSGVMSPLLDPHGRLRGYSKVMRDHTARRLAEQRLRASEERLRLFSESVQDYALVPVDLGGKVSGWNPGAARIFGYTDDEILGHDSARLFSAEDVASGEPDKDLRRAAAVGRAEDERWMLRKDGSRFWSHRVTTPMRDGDGQLLGFAKVMHDSSERKAAEELRARLEARERELLATQVRSRGEALDRTKEELQTLARSLLTLQEDERRHLARELHDDLSQRLAVLAMRLSGLHEALPDEPASWKAEVRGLEQYLALLANEVRRMSHRLHPAILDDLGLEVALGRLVEEFQAGRARPARYHAHDLPETISRDVAAALYRIAQEALRNVSKHAGADPVQVTLTGRCEDFEEVGALCLVIDDGGPGFDLGAVRSRGLGIISMQERAHKVGARLHVRSRPGEGTSIRVLVPSA